MLQFMWLQRIGHNRVTEQQRRDKNIQFFVYTIIFFPLFIDENLVVFRILALIDNVAMIMQLSF